MTTRNLNTFGKRLNYARHWRGFSGGGLAAAMDVSGSHISKLMADDYDPRLSDVVRLCQLLRCRVEWIAEGRPPIWLPGTEIEAPEPFRDGRRERRKASGSGEHKVAEVVHSSAKNAPPGSPLRPIRRPASK